MAPDVIQQHVEQIPSRRRVVNGSRFPRGTLAANAAENQARFRQSAAENPYGKRRYGTYGEASARVPSILDQAIFNREAKIMSEEEPPAKRRNLSTFDHPSGIDRRVSDDHLEAHHRPGSRSRYAAKAPYRKVEAMISPRAYGKGSSNSNLEPPQTSGGDLYDYRDLVSDNEHDIAAKRAEASVRAYRQREDSPRQISESPDELQSASTFREKKRKDALLARSASPQPPTFPGYQSSSTAVAPLRRRRPDARDSDLARIDGGKGNGTAVHQERVHSFGLTVFEIGRFRIIENAMTLVYRTRSDELELLVDGLNLSPEIPTLISMKRLQEVKYESSGTKLILEMSRKMDRPRPYRFHLNLVSEKSLNDLCHYLHAWNPSLELKSLTGERMQKICQRDHSEWKRVNEEFPQRDKHAVLQGSLDDERAAMQETTELELSPPLRRSSRGNRQKMMVDSWINASSRSTPQTHDARPIGREFDIFEHLPKQRNFGRKWKSPLVYPPTGLRKTVVEFTDLPRLEPGTFLNDNIISFYLRYLEHSFEQHNARHRRKVYFFNTFFYASLTGSNKKPINYEAVEKWTSKIDLFSYDYVVVPVNEQTHWYLAIICNLPRLGKTVVLDDGDDHDHDKDADPIADFDRRLIDEVFDFPNAAATATATEKAAYDDCLPPAENGNAGRTRSPPCPPLGMTKGYRGKKAGRRSSGGVGRRYDAGIPLIITLDSMGVPHPQTVKNLKLYLVEESRVKRGLDVEAGDIQGLNAKGIPLQSNSFDCGVFLLGYVEGFLENPGALVRRVARRDPFGDRDWEKLGRPDEMRAAIMALVLRLHEAQESASGVGAAAAAGKENGLPGPEEDRVPAPLGVPLEGPPSSPVVEVSPPRASDRVTRARSGRAAVESIVID
ncbi:MAG: hypothetical protein M1825_005814 [Sarcosagium campestre]|nr:MAG: hypothetical protein M1825_005814 [Sarcosagium campestre]